MEGWGRWIKINSYVSIGWWKNGALKGNSMWFSGNGKSTIQGGGWYENLNFTAYRKSSKEYPYWKMKDEYFIKSSNMSEVAPFDAKVFEW